MITARAVRIRGAGGVEALSIDDLEVRAPGPHEVLVEVAAAGLNRADLLQRRGFYPAPPGVIPDVPGLEFAGTVAALGAGVSAVQAGDRVMGIAGGGAMATHLVVHERELVPVPANLSLEQAAAVPEVFFTAYDALFAQGGLGLGETVLVHAVASGVGTAALQLARAAGARVIGTTRSQDKRDRLRDLGLVDAQGQAAQTASVLTDAQGRFGAQVRAHAGERGVDLIIDTVGAAYLEENIQCLATRGRLVIVGLLGGAIGSVPLALLLSKRITVTGTVLRSRPLEEKAALARRVAAHVVPLLAAGTLRPVIDQVLPMHEVAAAHARMEANQTVGKLVLRW